MLLCSVGATDEPPAWCVVLAHKLPGTAWWGGAADDGSLIALPASAASREHPGNCSPGARSSWSHEPEFSVQFISQPFWSTPCLLRTTNPAGTRRPGFSGKKGDQQFDFSRPGYLSLRPPFGFAWVIIRRSRSLSFCFFFFLFIFFFYFFFLTSCLWCRSQVFCDLLGSIASSIAEDDDSWRKGGVEERSVKEQRFYLALYMKRPERSVRSWAYLPFNSKVFLIFFFRKLFFLVLIFFPPVVVVPAESSCLLWRLKATCQPPPQTRSLRLPWRPSIFANSECRWMENGSACASWTTSRWHPTQSLPTKVRSGSLPRHPCIVPTAAQVGRGCLRDEMLLFCLQNLDIY